MRTFVYVDGFNLFYGALKGTSWKWLDLPALFAKVLQPHHDILTVKYFNSPSRFRSTMLLLWTSTNQCLHWRPSAIRSGKSDVDNATPSSDSQYRTLATNH